LVENTLYREKKSLLLEKPKEKRVIPLENFFNSELSSKVLKIPLTLRKNSEKGKIAGKPNGKIAGFDLHGVNKNNKYSL